MSPVGLWGNALATPFSDKVQRDEMKPPGCINCLKKCSRRFCIIQALIEARVGNLEQGLVFAGEHVYRIKEIMSVKDIFAMFFSGLDYRD